MNRYPVLNSMFLVLSQTVFGSECIYTMCTTTTTQNLVTCKETSSSDQ